ncbi:hypothetical protein DFJ73DRAFT_758136 [Zopfochytrium polystomum]|nr:hypothetical protein DFJ73DRAFT_758136 [Zopfochytrium polystomum]
MPSPIFVSGMNVDLAQPGIVMAVPSHKEQTAFDLMGLQLQRAWKSKIRRGKHHSPKKQLGSDLVQPPRKKKKALFCFLAARTPQHCGWKWHSPIGGSWALGAATDLQANGFWLGSMLSSPAKQWWRQQQAGAVVTTGSGGQTTDGLRPFSPLLWLPHTGMQRVAAPFPPDISPFFWPTQNPNPFLVSQQAKAHQIVEPRHLMFQSFKPAKGGFDTKSQEGPKKGAVQEDASQKQNKLRTMGHAMLMQKAS